MSAMFLISGKFMGLLSPFILKGIVNSMVLKSVASAGGVGTTVIVASSTMRFWKAGLALMLWGATRALSSVLV